jgi:hypothetical protein
MNIRYRVDLGDIERAQLPSLLKGGKHAARKIKRAQILLAADAGLADIHYSNADHIRVVMDNLSTHTTGALYEAFPAQEAHRILCNCSPRVITSFPA